MLQRRVLLRNCGPGVRTSLVGSLATCHPLSPEGTKTDWRVCASVKTPGSKYLSPLSLGQPSRPLTASRSQSGPDAKQPLSLSPPCRPAPCRVQPLPIIREKGSSPRASRSARAPGGQTIPARNPLSNKVGKLGAWTVSRGQRRWVSAPGKLAMQPHFHTGARAKQGFGQRSRWDLDLPYSPHDAHSPIRSPRSGCSLWTHTPQGHARWHIQPVGRVPPPEQESSPSPSSANNVDPPLPSHVPASHPVLTEY